MTRFSFLVVGVLALGAVAGAQQGVEAMRLPGPVRSAGVYHVVTGTWTHGAAQTPSISATKVYSADTPSGYFGVGWETSEGVDEGILPGTGNAEFGGFGTNDEYFIDGFEFAYCTQELIALDWEVEFYDSYWPCDFPDAGDNFNFCVNLAGSVVVSGTPGGAINACWVVTVDLSGGAEICMAADGGPCNPGFDGEATNMDHFGWGLTLDPATYSGLFTGPVIAGYDPMWAIPGEGTCYNPGPGCGGTGLNMGAGAQNQFGIGAPLSGCFFGGYQNSKGCGGPAQSPGRQFHFNLYADCDADCPTGPCYTQYCDATDGNPGNDGEITASSCSLANTITIDATGVAVGQNGYLLVGDGQGMANPNQGTLCVLGPTCIGRYVLDVQNSGGAGTYSTDISNSLTGGPNYGLPAACSGNIQAGETWYFQYWHRLPGGLDTFTQALCVPFTN